MTVVKWRSVALANAVKCGTTEDNFFEDKNGTHGHDIYYQAPIFVSLVCRQTGRVTKTSLYNVKYWWTYDDDQAEKTALEKAFRAASSSATTGDDAAAAATASSSSKPKGSKPNKGGAA